MPNDLEDYSEDYCDELEKSVTKLLGEPWKEALINNRNHFLAEVFYIDKKRKRAYYDKEIFNVYRAKGKSLTRTGFVTIRICEENYQKIKQRYNIDITHTFIAIVGVISTPGSNHNEYELINEYVRKNQEEIMYLVNLFGNKDSNEYELFEIVEKCLKFGNQIATGNLLEGGQK